MARKSIKTVEDKQTADQEHVDNNQDMDKQNTVSPEAVSVEYMAYTRSRCGGALRTVREKQGLSVHDVASKLKISGRQIEAIEADQFTDLPESTIVRGFIRNYAKLLKIEVEPLLDAYNVLVPSKQPLAFTVKPSTTMKVSSYEKPKTGRYIGSILFVFLILGVWYFYQNYIDKPSPILPIASVENVEPMPQAALPAAERVEQSVDIPLPAADATQAKEAENSVNTADNANVQASPDTLIKDTSANPITAEAKPAELAAGTAKLEFNANQETWVSVVDESGKEIYNKIIFAGSRDSLSVKLPIDVVVGNAGGASMTVNNKLMDLAPHTRSNVARIKVDKIESNQFE